MPDSDSPDCGAEAEQASPYDRLTRLFDELITALVRGNVDKIDGNHSGGPGRNFASKIPARTNYFNTFIVCGEPAV